LAGVLALLILSSCQQPPAESDGHKITKTEKVNGKKVNTLESTDKDLDEVRAEAAEMKKTTDTVVFTPDEQKAKK
jgi:hypothetical protein